MNGSKVLNMHPSARVTHHFTRILTMAMTRDEIYRDWEVRQRDAASRRARPGAASGRGRRLSDLAGVPRGGLGYNELSTIASLRNDETKLEG